MSDDLLSILDENDLSLYDFSAADREFLRAVAEEGEANTSDIRGYGLKRQQIHYRYRTMEEDGLITVERVGVDDHDGRKQNVATLTELGEQLVDAGLLEEVADSNTNLEEIVRRFEKLREDAGESLQRADRNVRKLGERLDSFEERLGNIEERLIRLENASETRTSADD